MLTTVYEVQQGGS